MITARVLPLTAWDGSSDLDFQTLLTGQSGCGDDARGRWRVIELVSRSGKPFEAELSWTSGRGGNLTAQVSVARSTRVGLFARALDVRVANLANAENKVSGVVANAHTFVQTRNQYEVRGEHVEPHVNPTISLTIPPFATHLSVYLADGSIDRSTWFLLTYDGQDTLRGTLPLSDLPSGGLEVGGAGSIALLAPDETAWRAVFTLSL